VVCLVEIWLVLALTLTLTLGLTLTSTVFQLQRSNDLGVFEFSQCQSDNVGLFIAHISHLLSSVLGTSSCSRNQAIARS
jgi:hypothetical protein